MRARGFGASVVALVVLAAALVGCSSSASGSSGSSGSSASPAAAPTTAAPTDPNDAAGDVKAATKPVGKRVDGSMRTADGRTRTYHVYLPASLPAGRSVPLLIALHGGMGRGVQYQANSGFDGLAEANRFIVVYPDGTPVPALPTGRVWNAGTCCAAAAEDRDDVDDVAFISALIDRLTKTYRVDKGRVFAAGHSNGAMMSYRLACELSGKIVGIGTQAGALLPTGTPCRPTKPVSVLAIHGTADTNVPLEGGKGSGLSGVAYPPPPDGPKTFAKLDGCGRSVTTTSRTNPDVKTRAWGPCKSGTLVRWITVEGANHAWMGHPATSAATASLVGEPYADFDSSLAIWRFLSALPRR